MHVAVFAEARLGEARTITGEHPQERRHRHVRPVLGQEPLGPQPAAPGASLATDRDFLGQGRDLTQKYGAV